MEVHFFTFIVLFASALNSCFSMCGTPTVGAIGGIVDEDGSGCFYVGPQFYECTGQCDSTISMPDPTDPDTQFTDCTCCQPKRVVQRGTVYACQVIDAYGKKVASWRRNGFYWTYESCSCNQMVEEGAIAGFGRKRRKRQNPFTRKQYLKLITKPNGQFTPQLNIPDVSNCSLETDTKFTSPCNPKGVVTICRSNYRVELDPNAEKRILSQISNAIKEGKKPAAFYSLNRTEYRFRPRSFQPGKWVIPQSVYRPALKTPEILIHQRNSNYIYGGLGVALAAETTALVGLAYYKRKPSPNT